jgi:hypothetical protein
MVEDHQATAGSVTVNRKKFGTLVWRQTHRDHRGGGDDGVRRVLHRNPATGGTESWPLSSFPESQLVEKLPASARGRLAKILGKDG